MLAGQKSFSTFLVGLVGGQVELLCSALVYQVYVNYTWIIRESNKYILSDSVSLY